MRNKDKYDLTTLDAGIVYETNGCGRRNEDTRKIQVTKDGELLYEKVTSKGFVKVLFDWLEADDGGQG